MYIYIYNNCLQLFNVYRYMLLYRYIKLKLALKQTEGKLKLGFWEVDLKHSNRIINRIDQIKIEYIEQRCIYTIYYFPTFEVSLSPLINLIVIAELKNAYLPL